MKLKYEAQKGIRIKYRFMGIDNIGDHLWWYPDQKRWKEMDESSPVQSWCNCSSVKAFRRRLKEWSKYLPSGTKFVLQSRWIGYSVYGETK